MNNMNKKQLTEYADYLLQTAMYKVQNITDAEDLVQETLLSGLVAIECGKPIDNLKNWLVTVLNRKYYDMLRRKYRKPVVSIDTAPEIPVCDDITEQIEQSEDAENIRRCLAYLTELYRQVMVRYYMHGESVKQIALALDIPENTVKSRLDTGRKHIRKDFTMENYTRQSYEPEVMWLCNSGESGLNNEPYSLVGDDRIKMNLLILAYEKPVTIPELARAIGISTTYIEPIVNKLVNGELMKRVADKVYTDFIIYTEKDRTANLELETMLAKQLYKQFWETIQPGLDELHQQDFYKALTPSQAIKLDSFFAIRTVQNGINNIKGEACGGATEFEDHPDRANGGKWYAMGNQYPAEYNWSENTYHDYFISGECDTNHSDYCDLKRITLCEYDCMLGVTHQGYGGDSNAVRYRMNSTDVMKMLYAIYSGNEKALPLINVHCFDNINGFIKLGFLAKNAENKVISDVPIIAMSDRWELYKLSEKYDNMISEKYHDELMQLMQNPVKLPPHLKSVPNWQRYMNCCSTFPMHVIMNAHDNGLFFAGRNFEENPVPAVFIAIEN